MPQESTAGPPALANVTSTLDDLLDRTITFGARALGFLAIMLVGWVVARVLTAATRRLLPRLGFDRMADRSGLSRWAGRRGASGTVAGLVHLTVALVTLQLALGVFGPNPVSGLLDGVIRWLPRAFVAIAILVATAAVGRILFGRISQAVGTEFHGRVVGRTVQVAVVALGAIAALTQLGIAAAVTLPILIAVLATVAGVIIVGVGGGLIGPMRDRWDRMLTWVDIERGRRDFERTRMPYESSHARADEPAEAPASPATPPLREAHQPAGPVATPAPAAAAEDSFGTER